MQSFEEWWAKYYRAEFDGSKPTVHIAREAWTACEFALNNDLGVAANESAKAERRKVAVGKLYEIVQSRMIYSATDVDAIIKEAQG